jgi:trigger factor
MKTEMLGQEKNIVKIKVELEAGEFAASLGETLRELSDKAKIPGFRKGHISRKILEMRFGRESLYAEALEKLLPKTLEQVVGDYDLETIAPPILDFDAGNVREGEPLTFELTFELTPAVSLPELEDIEVERPRPQEVTDAMIDGIVAEFRRTHSTLTSVDRAAGEGDIVSVSCLTRVFDADGNATEREPQNGDIDLSDTVRSEIREALLGKSKGERAEAEFVVETEHEDKDLAGKKIRQDFTVEAVQERVLPEMAPELYKKVTGFEIESEDAFKEELKKRLRANFENDVQAHVSNSAIEQVVAKSELDIPDTLLNRQMEFLKKRDASEAERRFNLSLEEYFRRASINTAHYEQNLREEAALTVRRTLVLDEVGKKFGVEVQKEELEAEITRLAAVYGIEPARMRATLYKSKDRLAEMANELRYSKIAQLIAEKVKVRDTGESSPPSPPLPETAAEAAEGAN